MINFFICSYFEGHWITNTKNQQQQQQQQTFLGVEYYLIRENPTSAFWRQTSVRDNVRMCEMWWYLVLPPPRSTPLPAGPEKEPRGRLPIFLQGLHSLQDLWVGWMDLQAAFFTSLLLFSCVLSPFPLHWQPPLTPPQVRGSGPPVSPATSISSSAPHSSIGKLTPGKSLHPLLHMPRPTGDPTLLLSSPWGG